MKKIDGVPSNSVGPTDRERILLWPLGTSELHEFTGVEHGLLVSLRPLCLISFFYGIFNGIDEIF